jgi:hypothetical protein
MARRMDRAMFQFDEESQAQGPPSEGDIETSSVAGGAAEGVAAVAAAVPDAGAAVAVAPPAAPAIDEAAEEENRQLREQTGLRVIQEDALSLRQAVESEYGALEAEWKKIFRVKAEAEGHLMRMRKESIEANLKENDRVKLNISGQLFEIRASHCTKNPFFRGLMCQAFAQPDPSGFFYLDRDPQYMHVIFDMLRKGGVDLSAYSDFELAQIRKEADYFMMNDLVLQADRTRHARKGAGLSIFAINSARSVTHCFHGLAFELSIAKRFVVKWIAFVAADRRRIQAEIHFQGGWN